MRIEFTQDFQEFKQGASIEVNTFTPTLQKVLLRGIAKEVTEPFNDLKTVAPLKKAVNKKSKRKAVRR